MSYLVLARKWRPKRFAELVGQEHVVRALTNALETGRLHHAFLFSGTRGVGKTTIARIFAKSLNCEQGTSAEPCGECSACLDIDAGRFLDLLEIDAASNTGVDDVRDVIENAQYMPSRGRVKVYLIDEVHMLSKAAFNALLKTLEEPPGHVKFLLATTDPQKLPVTVLSRCLQFNLKRLDEAQIGGQIHKILQAEGMAVDAGAVRQLSKAADGSLRDGLSLLDQAIAYTGGKLEDAAVAAMLGTVDRSRVGAILAALADGDGTALLAEVTALAEFSPDWGSVLEALTEALHHVQVRQLVPDATIEHAGTDVDALAASLRPEVVQLWYQMALNGRRDLPFAPSPRAGFEMSVLRMLAFRPAGEDPPRPSQPPVGAARAAPARAPAATRTAATSPADVATPVRSHSPQARAETPPPPSPQVMPDPGPGAGTDPVVGSGSAGIADADDWHALIATSGLRGPGRLLAEHAGFVGYRDGVLSLSLAEEDALLRNDGAIKMVCQALAPTLGEGLRISFESATRPAESLRERNERVRDQRQVSAEQAFMTDPDVKRLMQKHGARLVPDSIRPLDEH
ncbi:MAG: DNA polymerase III subunit gamma/tau [Lysobacter sp.]|nr:DNA polymerase III subunit gamma/tau [Lysobacter sp.]